MLSRALDHHKLDLVDLLSVIIRNSFNYLQFLEIPNDQSSIFRTGCHVPIALADGNVDDNLHVAVQGGLQDEGVLAPDLYDPTKLE